MPARHAMRAPRRLRRWRLFAAVNEPRPRFPVVVSLCGVDLLGDRLVSAFVSQSPEAQTVEFVEADAAGLMGDEEVEDGPHERQAAFLAGEATHHLWPVSPDRENCGWMLIGIASSPDDCVCSAMPIPPRSILVR